jgi:hypothetical protein
MSAESRRVAGSATFQHGARTYRLPLEIVEVEEIRAAGRAELHVSLVYRDAKKRVLALAFVHRGPGPLPRAASIDLTVSTPSGVSIYQQSRSTCDIVITAAGATSVEGTGSCRGLTDFGGESAAPDLTRVRFTARSARGPAPAGATAGAGHRG